MEKLIPHPVRVPKYNLTVVVMAAVQLTDEKAKEVARLFLLSRRVKPSKRPVTLEVQYLGDNETPSFLEP